MAAFLCPLLHPHSASFSLPLTLRFLPMSPPFLPPFMLCRYVEVENTEVLRQHLMNSTYVSGTSTGGAERGDYKERRGYYRRR